MTLAAETWAWRQTAGGSAEKLVLLALAKCADADGRCSPSRRDIADRTEQSRQVVERALQTLAARGLILRESCAETAAIALVMTEGMR